jgi:hypothetical protein
LLVSSMLAYSSTLKVEAIPSSVASANLYQTTTSYPRKWHSSLLILYHSFLLALLGDHFPEDDVSNIPNTFLFPLLGVHVQLVENS